MKNNWHVMEEAFIRKGFTWLSEEEATNHMEHFKDFFPDVNWSIVQLDDLTGWPTI